MEYRVGEVCHWKQESGSVLWPFLMTEAGLMDALSSARYAGMPRLLETWLLCVALKDCERWVLVRDVLLSLNSFEPWAIDEAGLLIVFGSPDAQRVRAKVRRVRAGTYVSSVAPVLAVLTRWLDRAARWVADGLIDDMDWDGSGFTE